MTSDPDGPSLERRVRDLEETVAALRRELQQRRSMESPPSINAAAEAARVSTAERARAYLREVPSESPGAGRQPPPSHWQFGSNLDLESLIGRYGTLVLATITALAAVGTFIGWAIAQGLLGPSQRIGLGLLTAAALAAGGLRLRRTERSFGASLLGLALAITHVCAWGAGPSLQLVPAWGAFLLAAAASIALAVFAHAEADEPLWSVGFSGAAIAPFVTASGKDDLLLLTAYGVAVLSSAGYAMGTRRWIVAGRLFLVAAGAYTLALATGFERDSGPLLAMAFPLLVALGGVVLWIQGWPRRERLRALGALATLSAIRTGAGMNLPFDRVSVTAMIVGAGLVWLVLVDRTHLVGSAPADERPVRWLYEGDWLDAGVLPFGFVMAAMMALDPSAQTGGLAMAGAAVVLMVTVVRHPHGSLRDAAVFAVVLCALIAAILLAKDRAVLLVASVALLSASCFAANRVWRSASWTTLGCLGLTWTVLACLVQLSDRPPYQYAPFLTQPSAASAVVLVCILGAWRLALDAKLELVLRGAALVWAFAWVHQELSFAFNQTVSTLLLVTYYASASVAAVGVGRTRKLPLLRHAGLGLALVAAGTALYGARHLGAIGARITAYLVAAVFLLAIAYWYRRPGTPTTSVEA